MAKQESRKGVGSELCDSNSANANASFDANWRGDCLLARDSQMIRRLPISIHGNGERAAANIVA